MKLHDSQTMSIEELLLALFYLLMKLHDSQTYKLSGSNPAAFYLLMKLHDSQTQIHFESHWADDCLYISHKSSSIIRRFSFFISSLLS